MDPWRNHGRGIVEFHSVVFPWNRGIPLGSVDPWNRGIPLVADRVPSERTQPTLGQYLVFHCDP